MKLFLLCLLVVALNTTSFNEDDTFSLEDRDNSACVIIREENNGEFSRNPCSITKIADKQWQVNMVFSIFNQTYTSLSSGAIANRVIDWLNFTDQYGKNIGRNVSVETLSNSHAQGQIIKNNHIVALGKSEYSYNVLVLIDKEPIRLHCQTVLLSLRSGPYFYHELHL